MEPRHARCEIVVISAPCFWKVLRGDNENSRKFTEVILAGCIPVLIADMPAWPYDRTLDYRRFTYEFDLQQVCIDVSNCLSRTA